CGLRRGGDRFRRWRCGRPAAAPRRGRGLTGWGPLRPGRRAVRGTRPPSSRRGVFWGTPPAPGHSRLPVLLSDELVVDGEQWLGQRHQLEDLVDRALGLHLAAGQANGEVVLAPPEPVGDV